MDLIGMGFRERLAKRQLAARSLVCVGLDPVLDKIPSCLGGPDRVLCWARDIVRATAPYACMFKPNLAYWLPIPNGHRLLGMTISVIHQAYPDIPVFLDCKCGDIDRSQQKYGEAFLGGDGLNADGMNFNPYMGKDCMSALATPKTVGKALVGLCYTSNHSARQIQDVCTSGGRKLWEDVAIRTLEWANELGVVNDAGLVMAAAYKPQDSDLTISSHLERCRELVGPRLWFLIPGIGTQGGFVEETVKAAYAGPGSVAINSSSGIIFASSGEDFAKAAGAKACELRDSINEASPK